MFWNFSEEISAEVARVLERRHRALDRESQAERTKRDSVALDAPGRVCLEDGLAGFPLRWSLIRFAHPIMRTIKFTSILLSAVVASAGFGMTACGNKGGGSGKKSERLKWVNRPTNGTVAEDGKVIKIPGLAVDFHVPDVLYVYKDCKEATHTPEGPDQEWIPVVRCSSIEAAGAGESSDEWDSESEDDEGDSSRVLTIYAAEKGDMLISERATASFKLQYEQAGFVVDSLNYFDEYMTKEGRRGIEVVAHTVDKGTGYPIREIKRFMFPREDVVFIIHVDYEYGADRSGINSDWERIVWNFQFTEDGPLFE
jgi:hypothetical protein